jgi:hypothetical protein
MNKIPPIILILFLLIPGCIQTSREETGKISEYSFPETGFLIKNPQFWNVSQTQEQYQLILNSPDNQAWIGLHLYQLEEDVLGTPFEEYEKIQISGVEGSKQTRFITYNDREYISDTFTFVQTCPELQNNRITYIIFYYYPKDDVHMEETVKTMFDSIELSCPSVNYYPNTGFKVKIPQSWNVNSTQEYYRVVFTSPDNQASINIEIMPSHHPEGEEEGGVGLSYEVPNSTTIESFENIQIAGVDGLRWTFLVNGSSREYIDGFISFTQNCPGLQYNRISYFINYDYTRSDVQLEETIKAMLDSIQLTCPSVN